MSIHTVKKWIAELDKEGKWLKYEEKNGAVLRVYCQLCKNNEGQLRALRNFSPNFISGITGSALKKDGCVKHMKSDMHQRAIALTNRPKNLEAIFKTTPIGKAFSNANNEEFTRVSKLIDIAYLIAKEEMPFTKFAPIAEMEKRHGVPLGNTYLTDTKCREFVKLIGESMRDEVLEDLKNAQFFSILMDGSTDNSVVEKELIYIQYIVDGKPKCHFLRMKDIADGTANGLKVSLEDTFNELDIEWVHKRLVCVCVDGAAVNLGVRAGLVALLRKDMPWLIGMHCLNHRLELSAKDAFSKTYMDEISTMLMNLFYVYEKSPKRLRELRNFADVMDEHVRKPEKAHGTRWLQHKSRALQSLLLSYPIIVTHLEALAAEYGTKSDAAKFKGYLRKLTSFKFILHMLFFDILLKPLAQLSCSLQSNSIDILFAIASLESFHAQMQMLKKEDHDGNTELTKFVEAVLASCDGDDMELVENVEFKGVPLNAASPAVLRAFTESKGNVIDKVGECVKGRFTDLQEKPVFKAVKLLDPCTWPKEEEALCVFGYRELTFLTEHFKELIVHQGIDTEAALVEWGAFKSFWAANMSDHIPRHMVWQTVMSSYKDKFPNLSQLISLLLVLPVSNAIVERGFSTMRRVKTDWRNGLNEETLDHLMRISLEGPPPFQFQSKKAADMFFSIPRRPNVEPYKRRHDEETD